MKRKQLLATMLAAAMLTSTVLSPAGNVTVRAMEMESINTEAESVSEETQETEMETELVSEEVQENATATELVSEEAEETRTESVLVIPEGTTFIREGEFRGNTEITKVVIPESVKSIWHGAFRDCSNLVEVEFSSNLTRIGVGAFSGTAWLENLKKDNDLVIVNHCLIDGKNAAGEVVIPEGVTVIAEGAFASNDNITKVTVPEGVTILGVEVFSCCDNLEEVVLPSTITRIDGDGGNWWGAFQECTGLKKIEVPEGVTRIDGYLFSDCSNLSEIKIPSTVTKIESCAFFNCSNLTDIYYAGTEAEWNQMEKSEANIPSTATIHYESAASNEGVDDSQKVILNNAEGIPDKKLYDIIVRNASKNDEILTVEEAAAIESLYIRYNEISDLKGIEYCTGLKQLTISGGKIKNIEVLSNLVNLTSLSLNENEITDIEALSNLVNLTSLTLMENGVTNIDILSNLVNLTSLTLSGNAITDISAMSSLTNLTSLWLSGKQIADISPLAGLTNLESLRIYNTSITDISPIADLVINQKLTDFYTYGNNIEIFGDFPAYVEYEEEVEVRYLTDADRIRIMEIFDLSEYDGKVICTDGSGVNFNKLETGSGAGFDYSIYRKENGDLVLGRCYLWYDDNSFRYGFNDTYMPYEDTKLTVGWEGNTVWILCHGDADASGLNFTDKVEKTTKVNPFAKRNTSGTITKTFAREFGVEAGGTLGTQDRDILQDYFGFEYWGGGINLIPTEGAEYRIDFDASSYEKEDVSKLQIEYYTLTRDENGELSISSMKNKPYSWWGWYHFENGKMTTSSKQEDDIETNFLTKGDIGSDIEDCTFTIPAMDKESDEIILMWINIYKLDGSWTGNLISYNDQKVLDFYNFTKIEAEDETEEENESYEVELPSDKPVVSIVEFKTLLKENKNKDIVIQSNDVTFTFKKGTMSEVEGMENYDFGTSIVSKFEEAGKLGDAVTKDNFVTRINYNYSGKLPAEVSIRFYVGTDLAGKTLHYSHVLEDGFKHLQSVVVDAEGYIMVKQDHCSDYVVTTEKIGTVDEDVNEDNDASDNDDKTEDEKAPDTDDGNVVPYAMTLMIIAGFVIVAMEKKKENF